MDVLLSDSLAVGNIHNNDYSSKSGRVAVAVGSYIERTEAPYKLRKPKIHTAPPDAHY